MAPRKRAKPNPIKTSAPTTQTPDTANQITSLAASTPPQRIPPSLKSNGSGDRAPGSAPGSKQVNKTRSWYGSLSKKATASTQVARETILGGTSKPMATADFTRFDTKKPSDMSADESSSTAPSSLPKSQEAGAGFTGDGTRDVKPPASKNVTKPENEQAEAKATAKSEDVGVENEDNRKEQEGISSAKPATEQSTDAPAPAAPITTITTRPTSTWLGGWWGSSQPPAPAPVSQPKATEQPATQETETGAPAGNQTPESKPQEVVSQNSPEQPVPDMSEAPAEQTIAQNQAPAAVGGGYGSWIWGWGTGKSVPASSQPSQDVSNPTSNESASEPPKPDAAAAPVKEPDDIVMQDAPPIEEAPTHASSAAASDPAPKVGSTWAFWSRQSGSTSGKKPTEQPDEGQLAVMGEGSENHPKRAKSMEFKGSPPKETPIKSGKKEELAKDPSIKSGKKEEPAKASAIAPSKAASIRRSKRDRPESMEIDDTTPIRPGTPKTTETPAKGAASKAPASATKPAAPNLVLPSFTSTYKLKENPSIVKQITRILLRGSQAPSNKHVYLSKDLPKIKKAIAIGVHGLFPANYLRTVIGQPTGTSIKFANHTADAIRRWADNHGCEDCEIEKVALEGEGKIGERVENLWKLLLNWIDQIRSADLILFGCHSQGVPVSIMLLAKLIDMGVINKARVGVCAMAGVSLGPFPDYRTSMGYLMGSAGELWAFGDPKSEVSQRLEAAIKVCLGYGARVTLVGSIDDQLVPLESAIYAPVHHPYIFRAAFIDGRIHAPDFIAHLVGFALKLRNLGVSDHGLIRELSTPLAGSLYSGEGHSRLYDEGEVYDLAVRHALETTDVAGGGSPECEFRRTGDGGGALVNPNPYHLPWIMRGLLEEEFVKTELGEETGELVRQFDDWKPVTKALKDVKYRLEAVRSKL
ncbi:hypothetical protein B0T21DRAFT_330436 [Apiosordaria backusii]|uniref:YMC020W-like alpha/beta hydrolase domain-containing protein n=1 Tax=Apiosordaria backusii TaxID=314023 RepID=A0AA40BMA1_9PEZI|nr:hypothetical protein B0T21DRAFT_330436 [Apiosordaria backusii]